MILRDYQRQSANDCHGAWYGLRQPANERILKVLATGLGKTIIGCKMMEYYSNIGHRCLFLAHRDRLIEQTIEKLSESTGLSCCIEKGQESALGGMFPITVGSVQSMTAKRLARFPRDYYSHIFVDEAHRSCSDSYLRIFDRFDAAKIAGITATAYRSDKKALGSVYQAVAGQEYNLRWAIENGWLVPIVAQTCQVHINAERLRSEDSADFTDDDVDEVLMPYLSAIAAEIKERAGCRKMILFLPLVRSSKAMCEALNAAGISCCHVDGTDQTLLKDFISGRYQACCNSMLLTEGIDIPDVDCVVPLRITKSTGLYTQMAGRGTRLISSSIGRLATVDERKAAIAESPKNNMLILDFLMHGAEHDMCHPAMLLGVSAEQEERMTGKAASGCEVSLTALADETHSELVHEREQKLLSTLKALSGKEAITYDPVLQSLSIFNDSLVEWEPSFSWESQPVSPGQKKMLERSGFDCSTWNKGFASQVIQTIIDRREQNLASVNQVRTLVRAGIEHAHELSFADASARLDSLSKKWEKSARYKAYKKRHGI